MPLRFKVLITAFMVASSLLWGSSDELASNLGGIFSMLGALLVVSVVSLWPNEGRVDRAERQANGSNWSDSLDIEMLADDFTKRSGGR